MIDHKSEPQQAELPQSSRLFNPNEHLIQIKGRGTSADYLPVAWRLVWFRSLCPDGTIETEVIHLDLDRETEEEAFQWNQETRRSEKVVKRARGFAIFRATVKDGRGGVATGTKSEKAASFPDFVEKAETGSIGRALAALGYGTQFTGDEFDEQHRIVDAPVERGERARESSQVAGARAAAGRMGGQGGRAVESPAAARREGPAVLPQPARAEDTQEGSETITEQQAASIRKLCQHLGKAAPDLGADMGYLAARELLMQLSQEYRQARSKAS